MTLLQTLVSLLVVAALGSYINHRYFKLPITIALMASTLSISLGLVLLAKLGMVGIQDAAAFFTAIDFDDALPHAVLACLLFTGALHVNLDDLKTARWQVAVLSAVGVLLAALIAAGLFWLVAAGLGFDLPFVYALLFGTLIAPTDPMALMGIIKKVGAPKALQTKIAGESLFNDGVAVVLFLTILGVVTGHNPPTFTHVTLFLLEEAVGGVVLGLILGGVAYQLLRSVDSYQVEILLTSAMVAGGYVFAEFVHVSAPIAMVVAGLLLGNPGRTLAMSEKTRERLADFWELVHQGLSAVLFILIGLEIIVLSLGWPQLLAGLAAIAIALIARFLGVALPIRFMSMERAFPKGAAKMLTWGAVRGGISIALALSLPSGPERELILTVTYFVVIFSVGAQGLTFARAIESITKGGLKAARSSGKKKGKVVGRARRAT
jgi:CPA1 family monovalent cation:H+ antiporter